jgi:hypothetical protein
MANESPLEHRYSPPGWEGRNTPLSMKDRNPWANLSEHSYSSRHLNRARHMAPQASSTRDSTQRDVWRGGATIYQIINVGYLGLTLEHGHFILLKCNT